MVFHDLSLICGSLNLTRSPGAVATFSFLSSTRLSTPELPGEGADIPALSFRADTRVVTAAINLLTSGGTYIFMP